jgi:hypothetical protein
MQSRECFTDLFSVYSIDTEYDTDEKKSIGFITKKIGLNSSWAGKKRVIPNFEECLCQ